MNIGFIGTGKIAYSVITGIFKSKIIYKKIVISPRNKEIAKKLKAGQTIINKKSRGSAPAPFGGFKMSGNGREHGQFGLEEYLEIKAII